MRPDTPWSSSCGLHLGRIQTFSGCLVGGGNGLRCQASRGSRELRDTWPSPSADPCTPQSAAELADAELALPSLADSWPGLTAPFLGPLLQGLCPISEGQRESPRRLWEPSQAGADSMSRARKRIGRGRFDVRFFIRVPKGSSHHLTKPRGAPEDRFPSILSEAGNRFSAGRAEACAWTWVPRCHVLGANHSFIFPPLPYMRTRPIYVT